MITKQSPIIAINDTSEERRAWLINAIASALRWYALTPGKRDGDEEDAVVLIDLLQELQSMSTT